MDLAEQCTEMDMVSWDGHSKEKFMVMLNKTSPLAKTMKGCLNKTNIFLNPKALKVTMPPAISLHRTSFGTIT